MMKRVLPTLCRMGWKAVFAFTTCAFSPIAAQADPARESVVRDTAPLRLTRPSVVGAAHRVNILATQERRASVEMPGQVASQPVEESQTVSMAGNLEVLAVNGVGNTTRMKLDVEKFSAEYNNKPLPTVFAGKTLFGNLADSAVNFMYTDGTALQPHEVAMLYQMFRPAASDTMNDLAGPDRVLTPGATWTPPTGIVKKAINLNQINLKDSELIAMAKAVPLVVDSQSCWLVDLDFKTDTSRTDFSFEFKISMVLPEDPEQPALRMRRESIFETVQSIDMPINGQLLPAGSKIRQRSREVMMADMKPIEKK